MSAARKMVALLAVLKPLRELRDAVLRVDGTLREDDGDALAVELLASDWRKLVQLAKSATTKEHGL